MDKRIAILAVLALTIPCWARVLTVDDDGPADYPGIQAAINNSLDGDTVVVRPGTYREQIAFNGRRITVRSENPADPLVVRATVIAADSGAGVVFDFREDGESVLTGLTVTGAGILCMGTSPTISGNVIRNCNGAGIKGHSGARPTIVGNQILANVLEGISYCDGLIQGNTISGNSAGLAFCNGSILDNVIADNGDAGGLYSCDGEIAGNTITGNYAATQGGGLYSCAGEIHHNVIAGNRALGQGGGLYACTKSIFANTLVGNRAGDSGGAMSQCPGAIYNNIIAFNVAKFSSGLHGQSANTYNCFWSNPGGNFGGGALAGLGDVAVDPRFALDGHWSDQGTADPGDDVWVHGDYHLRSQAGRWDAGSGRWVVDGDTSLCIDAGRPSSDWTAELWPHGKRVNLGAYGGTPQASLSLSDVGRPADLNHDEKVGPGDLMLFSQGWLTDRKPTAEDLDRNGIVDFTDLALLAAEWRVGGAVQTAPIPSPMTFAVPPVATGPYSIAMVATTATSTDGTGVEYYFEDYFTPAVNSGWRSYGRDEEPRWEDFGLQPRTLYWYRVKARNRGNRLETQWSERLSDTTAQEDRTAPVPNPAAWQIEPHGVSAGTIRMTATTAVDDSGVEYQFECASHPAYSSRWQESATYEAANLPAGNYVFRVRARDKSPNHNTTLWSNEVLVDLLAPTPNPMKWIVEPKEFHSGKGTFEYSVRMTAAEATDNSGGVEYYFQCTSEPGFSSGWQTSPSYTVLVGRSGQRHRFRVKARDISPSHNETAWSPELPSL